MAPEVKAGFAVLLSNVSEELLDRGNDGAEMRRVLDMMGEGDKYNKLLVVKLDERRVAAVKKTEAEGRAKAEVSSATAAGASPAAEKPNAELSEEQKNAL